MIEELEQKKIRLDRWFHAILISISVIVSVAIVATFIQIYDINAKINNEVKQIQAAQIKNHSSSNDQYSVILSYLVCIGAIQPADRTTSVIQDCVSSAEKHPLSIPIYSN